MQIKLILTKAVNDRPASVLLADALFFRHWCRQWRNDGINDNGLITGEPSCNIRLCPLTLGILHRCPLSVVMQGSLVVFFSQCGFDYMVLCIM